MSYAAHDFKPRQILTSTELNEMDEQIAANVVDIQTASGAAANAVKYTEMDLTDAQKAQTRSNIGLAFTDAGNGVIVVG